jgi:hypothetical protein
MHLVDYLYEDYHDARSLEHKVIHMVVDPGILLPHQLTDPLQEELSELPLDPVHHSAPPQH